MLEVIEFRGIQGEYGDRLSNRGGWRKHTVKGEEGRTK